MLNGISAIRALKKYNDIKENLTIEEIEMSEDQN
jgi:hypothetical protein